MLPTGRYLPCLLVYLGTDSHLGNVPPIDYLSKANQVKLRLVQGDEEMFSEVLSILNDYEGELSRSFCRYHL